MGRVTHFEIHPDVRRRGDRPEMGAATNAYVCTTSVDSLDDTITKVESNGGTIVVPKMGMMQHTG